MEEVAAPEADFLMFYRKAASVKRKLDLVAASDEDGDGKTSATKKRHNTSNGATPAAAASITYPKISYSGGRRRPLG